MAVVRCLGPACKRVAFHAGAFCEVCWHAIRPEYADRVRDSYANTASRHRLTKLTVAAAYRSAVAVAVAYLQGLHDAHRPPSFQRSMFDTAPLTRVRPTSRRPHA